MFDLEVLNETLERDGVLIKENLLPKASFNQYRKLVNQSWREGTNWSTKIKIDNQNGILPRQPDSKISFITENVRQRKSDDEFQYLYHAMHQSKDSNNLVLTIVQEVRDAWHTELSHIAPSATKTSFSLTCFTPGCFLDPHNDHSQGENPFAVTLLLYFGSDDQGEGGGLVFNYRGTKRVIEARSNVGVLFVPSPETEHWVDLMPENAHPRLALSGWLL